MIKFKFRLDTHHDDKIELGGAEKGHMLPQFPRSPQQAKEKTKAGGYINILF